MIVSSRTAAAIRAGRVTQIRLPRVTGRRCPLRAGHDYPVQVLRGKRITGDGPRIEVLAAVRQLAGDITQIGAKHEGFRTTDDWKIAWVRKYDSAYRRQRAINDYLFDTGGVDRILLLRFAQAHAACEVWAIVFKPTVGKRYLARPTRTSGDYVTHPGRAIDRVECIDADVQERYAKDKREEGERRRASFRRDLEEARAQQKGIANANLSNRALRHINAARQRTVTPKV